MKVGMVLEGGALRTIFSTGVLDAMLEQDLMADYVVGVSAGIACMGELCLPPAQAQIWRS